MKNMKTYIIFEMPPDCMYYFNYRRDNLINSEETWITAHLLDVDRGIRRIQIESFLRIPLRRIPETRKIRENLNGKIFNILIKIAAYRKESTYYSHFAPLYQIRDRW